MGDRAAHSESHAGTFDYIVVGAGSAGCVLANRLSEDAGTQVCLVEAGPRDTSPLIHIPVGILPLLQHPRLNWCYATVPQTHASGRSIPIPRGRVMGGSSSINGMVYMRGHPRDYDDWAAAGSRGWSYSEVLPYFMRSENNQASLDPNFHGTRGELSVVDPDPINPLIDVFFAASKSVGLPRTSDFNGANQEGYGLRQLTQRRGRRESTATAFVRPARNRSNLTILTDAMVDRVTFDGRKATGVALLRESKQVSLAARREVILSAGVVCSPTILNRSGIGNAEDLRGHGIAVLHDLPGVGLNLQDHICADVNYTSSSSASVGISLKSLPRVAMSMMQYLVSGRGILAAMPMDSGAFVRSPRATDRPDVQLIFAAVNREPTGRVGIGHGYGMTPMVLRPKSKGFVKLASADPEAPPLIDPQFFSEEEDLDLLLFAVTLSIQILEAPAFDAFRGQELQPGDSVRDPNDLKQFIRQVAHTAYHPVGTCKMGAGDDAVVDAELRVRGVEGLRVVDAAIMPTIIGGNTNAPTIMIAEKASDMIRGRPPLEARRPSL